VALFDVLKLYGRRVSELHLRQSDKNVWTEALGPGDIDYPLLAQRLARIGVEPHLVLEQAPEQGTPKTMDAVESAPPEPEVRGGGVWRRVGIGD